MGRVRLDPSRPREGLPVVLFLERRRADRDGLACKLVADASGLHVRIAPQPARSRRQEDVASRPLILATMRTSTPMSALSPSRLVTRSPAPVFGNITERHVS